MNRERLAQSCELSSEFQMNIISQMKNRNSRTDNLYA